MGLSTFNVFILILTLGFMHLYGLTRERFNGVVEYKEKLERTRAQLEKDQTAQRIEREHFLEFKQQVATLIPEALQQHGLGEEGYGIRNLASVMTRAEADGLRLTIARTLFEKGKEEFRNGNYEKSVQAFRALKDRYGYTAYIPESYFLLIESLYKANRIEESTQTIGEMVELFPSHELTGFSLVRLGKIYESQKRGDEAVDIYKTVLNSFSQKDVIEQARSSLRQVEL